MIRTKQDLKDYIFADKKAQGIGENFRRPKLIGHTYWKYTMLLRKCEYHLNSNHIILSKIYRFLLVKKSYKYSTIIEPNVFGPGLCIAHFGGIVVSGKAKIGKNCYLHQCVTVGVKDGDDKAPVIGDDCNIGTGAVLLGNINIADHVTIGANAVVIKNIDIPYSVWGGVPAKMLYIKKHR